MNTIISRLMFSLCALLFATAFALAAPAQKPYPVAVKYLGSINQQPVFLVEFDNEAEEEVLIVLKDSDGITIYSERSRAKKFSKKFQVHPAEAEASITLMLYAKNGKQPQVFQIAKNVRIVEDVIVTQVR